jgi:AcrR family transcriptional regulator
VTDSPADLADDGIVVERILRGAIDAFRARAFHEVDVDVVAAASGVDAERIGRFFPKWDALLLVVYDRWTQLRGQSRRAHEHPATTIDYVRMTLAEDVDDPGLVRVLAGVINIAGAGDHTFADLFRRRYEDYHVQLAGGLQMDFDAGREASVVPAGSAATQLLAVYQGLQIQMLVRPSLDVMQQFDFAAQTLREGWSRRSARAWDLDDLSAADQSTDRF